MPQELITVQYCKQHQCALLARTPTEIATAALRLKNEHGLDDSMRARLASARPAGRPETIVRWIACRDTAAP
jgi:processive 1,2-diacylglycerol beta-glucosyltransferase